ncbi:MAG: hypothetical protein LBS58_00100 [Coriobacteriales bacterium]|nr:hypothetical protein [Coriobacteriales bacterium]
MSDLVVVDSEYEELQKYIIDYGKAAETMLASYLTVMNDVHTAGLVSGNAATNLKAFNSRVEKLQGTIQYLTQAISNKLESFVEAIDDKDEYLY